VSLAVEDIALQLALAMVSKSGIREWSDQPTRLAISQASREMAIDILFGDPNPPEPIFMVSRILLPEMDGTPKQIVFKSSSYSPAAADDLRITTDGSKESPYAITLASVANAAARQSVKADLGAKRAPAYKCRAAFELAATPTAGLTISLYWAPSPFSTAGYGNPGGVSGTDAAYTGYSSNIAASLQQLDKIGDFICTAQATSTVQIAEIGILEPTERYGSIVVYDNSGAAFHSSDANISIVLDPLPPEGQ
jgi:hypothetical protein